jgi:DNA-binding beta-propeller fold protein YncE
MRKNKVFYGLILLCLVMGTAFADYDATLPQTGPIHKPLGNAPGINLAPPLSYYFAAPDGATRGLSFDGTYLWVANSGDGNSSNGAKIYRVNPVTGAIISTFDPPAASPCGLEFDGQYLWLSVLGATIYKLDTLNMSVVRSFSAVGGMPFDLAFDGQYLYQTQSTSIYVLDTATGTAIDTVFATYSSPNVRPFGLVYLDFPGGAQLWTCDGGYGSNMVNAWDFTQSIWIDQWPANPTTYPCGLAYDSVGKKLFVSCWTLDSIYVFDLSSYGIEIGPGSTPINILKAAPNPFLNHTTLDDATGQVEIFDCGGRLIETAIGRTIGQNLKTGVYFLKAPGCRPLKIVKLD